MLELQQALVNLTNSKVELADQLDTVNRRLRTVAERDGERQQEVEALTEQLKEREITIANLRSQVRHLETSLVL